jgi:hypothetical protein
MRERAKVKGFASVLAQRFWPTVGNRWASVSFEFSKNERRRNAAWRDYITFAAAILQLFLAIYEEVAVKR